ncbi:MAG: aldehyde dehydrogenase family protein [Spirochaetaceae bacterium]|nr:MAG: aldehyde dehydrogenase family protein [Spirochaetaceae bacterium]
MTEIVKPATGEFLAAVENESPESLKEKVARARAAQPAWAALTVRERARHLRLVREFVVTNADRISGTIADCTGKTLNDAFVTETFPAALAVGYYCKAVARFMRPRRLGRSSVMFFNKRSYLYNEPYGVVGIISPWNYPFGIPFHEVVAALLAGNAVVLKVAGQAQPVGGLFAEMMRHAGIPDDVFSVVTMAGAVAGSAMIHSGIAKLFFTGSVAVGKRLMAEAADVLLPVSLELGGNDAMIVCDDANVARAASGAVWAGLSNAGQSCGGVERIYVYDPVYDEFMSRLETIVAGLRHGVDLEADIGSLTTASQKQTVEAHISDALAKGARIRARSSAPEDGFFHAVVVLENVTHEMDVMRHETFGPILAVMRVESEDEAVRLANDSYLGLTASVWTKNTKTARRIAARLEAGAVTVNDHLMSHGMAETPWGGYKQSSIGRSHGGPGLSEVVRSKVVVHDSLHRLPRNIWWHPYSGSVYRGLKSGLFFLFGTGSLRRLAHLFALIRFYLSRLKY